MDGAPRVARSPPPSPCRRLQSSLVLLVVVCHLLFLGHHLWTAVSGCDSRAHTKKVFVNTTNTTTTTTTTEPSQYTEHCWNKTCSAKCCADQQGIASPETINCSGNETFTSARFVRKVISTYQKLIYNPQEQNPQKNSSEDVFLFYNKCKFKNYNPEISRYEFTYNNSPQIDFSILAGGTFFIYKGMVDCVDFVAGTDLMVLVGCNIDYVEPSPKPLSELILDVLLVACMIVSTIAISLVLAIYLYIPQLQGVHRNILLCYLVLVMVLHPTLILWNYYYLDFDDAPTCYNLLVFLVLSSVSWLTVMSYDIWSTFSRPLRPRFSSSPADSDNHKFLVYSLVGWGYPIIHLLLMVYVKCITGYVIFDSVSFTMGLNLVMFLSTVVNIRILHSHQTDVHNSHRHNHTQQGVLLYVKLSLLMGVDWVIFVSSWTFNSYVISGMSYVLLESQGTLLFVLLVCNRRVLRLIRDKWRRQPPDIIRLQ